MASDSERTRNNEHRKLARGFSARDPHTPPVETPEQLQDQTLAACKVAFERRWGAFYGTGELVPVPGGVSGDSFTDFRQKARAWFRRFKLVVNSRRGIGRMFVEFWAGDGGNAALERACRVRYEAIRNGNARALDEVGRALAGEPDGAGGMAATYLKLFVVPGLVPPEAMPTFEELEGSHPEMAQRDRKQGRAAFVARYGRPVPWLGGSTMTNREIAEAGILCGVWPGAPEDWERLFSTLDPPTPARVIEEAETGVRRLRASGTG